MLFNFQYFKEVYIAFFILLLIIVFGTMGFMLVENYTFSEAFYMTIITVSTVGFSEVRELSSAGRMFTSLLIITSFGTFAFAVTSITKYLAGGEYKTYFRDYKVNKEIIKISNHVIICGYGRNGRQAVKTLNAHKMPYIIVESNPRLIAQLQAERKFYIEGDATEEENLLNAGLNKAQALITTLPKDSDNLFVVLTARELNPKLTIISRASADNSDKKLRIAGADNVIMPDMIGGQHMATLVVTPDVVEFLDHISLQGKADVNLEEIAFDNLPDDFKGKTIKELNSRFTTGCSIIGFKSLDGEYIINPSPELQLVEGIKLFVLGSPEQIKALNRIFNV
ncbi:MAG: potassium channel protein [Flavobacteriales bacterium]|nr:potassium channel protein [Flavobacteriales bacterium]